MNRVDVFSAACNRNIDRYKPGFKVKTKEFMDLDGVRTWVEFPIIEQDYEFDSYDEKTFFDRYYFSVGNKPFVLQEVQGRKQFVGFMGSWKKFFVSHGLIENTSSCTL